MKKITKNIFVLFFGLLFSFNMVLPYSLVFAENQEHKIDVCHKNGQSGNWNVLNIDENGSENGHDGDFLYKGGNPKDDKWCIDNDPNKPEDSKPEKTGSIKICKIILNSKGESIVGKEGDDFSIPFINASYEGPSAGVPSPVSFSAPFSETEKVLGYDAECQTVENLSYGRYYYDEEIISDSENWEDPVYNDGASGTPTGLSNFGKFNTDLAVSYDNFDGIINISESTPFRTLIVVNKQKEITEVPNQCNIVSDITNIVQGSGDPAVEAWKHASWVQSITDSLATWIWGSEYINDPAIEEVQTFMKSFNVDGVVQSANIKFAVDNGYILKINGDLVEDSINSENNYSPLKSKDVSSYIDQGLNTIEFTVKNLARPGMSKTENPAGLLYDLEISILGECEDIVVPTEDKTPPSISFLGFRDQSSASYDNSVEIKSCGSINTSGYISWEWQLNDGEQSLPVNYNYTITSGPTAVGYTAGPLNNTYYNGGIPMLGTYEVSVTGTDSVGNTSSPISCSVTYASVPEEPVIGCMDETANNYNQNATEDTDPTSCTYNEEPEVIDVCKNITGNQEIVPNGYTINDEGECTKNKTRKKTGSYVSQGQVLGESTSCGIYVDKFLRKDLKGNDKEAVIKVQKFLNDYMGYNLKLDGVFGNKTDIALKAFQKKHADKILNPWGLKAPTGIFYLTTQTEVNNIMCPDLKLPIPELVTLEQNPLFPKY